MKRILTRFSLKGKPLWGIYIFFIISIYVMSFVEPLTHAGSSALLIVENLLPAGAVALFIYNVVNDTKTLRKLMSPFFILGVIFVLCGMLGWAVNQYQTFWITAQSMYEHIRFWLCLYLFTELFKILPTEKYAKRLFFHIMLISSVTVISCALDMLIHIWPRQMYRYGTSSLQIFYGHPSILAAHTVFLLVMLCILFPYFGYGSNGISSAGVAAISMIFLLVLAGVMTLRVRMFGFAIFFAVLFIYMLIFRRRLYIPVILIGASGAAAVGWRRFYDYYFSPYAFTMARGQFAIHSLDIAREYFPLGSGFATFGSRMAQIHYSPLYYKYEMFTTTGITPDYPAYACDTFFPCILGECGWIGFLAYAGLILMLGISILKNQKQAFESDISRYSVFAAILLFSYELLETTGTLAFSENYSILISMALALALVNINGCQNHS